MTDRCTICDRPRATLADFRASNNQEAPGCLAMCWAPWSKVGGDDCARRCVDWRDRAQRAEAAIEAFATTVDDAARHHESRGAGGQHVPFYGDFASAPPSVMVRLKWWAKHLKESKDG